MSETTRPAAGGCGCSGHGGHGGCGCGGHGRSHEAATDAPQDLSGGRRELGLSSATPGTSTSPAGHGGCACGQH